MAFSVGNPRLCDICFENESRGSGIATGSEGTTAEVQCKEEESSLFPGCEGSVTFNKHLRVYFTVTRLLKLPSSQFIKLFLKRSTSSGKDRRDGSGVEDKDNVLYSRICANCELIVDEAIDLHDKIMGMQKKIDKLGERLFELKEIGERKKEEVQGKKMKSNKNEKAEENMLDLSLACLQFGLAQPTTKANNTPKKRSIKAALRKPKPKPRCKKAPLDCDPLSSDFLSKRDPLGDETYPGDDVQVKEEINQMDEKFDLLKTGKKEWLAAEEVMEDVHMGERQVSQDDEDDDPDNDDDYVPSQSTDEELGGDDDGDDMDYEPEDTQVPKKRQKRSRNRDEDEMEHQVSDSNNEDEDNEEEDEYEEIVISGGIGNTTRDFNINDEATVTTTYEYQCPECALVFPRPYKLNAHTKSEHGFEMTYPCPRCPDLKFKNRLELVKHRNDFHGYTCEKCGKRVTRFQALIQHYKRIHKINFTFACPICKEVFQNSWDLRIHRSKNHILSAEEISRQPKRAPATEEENYWASNPCSECGKVFLSEEELDSHLAYSHEQKLKGKARKAIAKRCYYCWKYLLLDQRHWIHRRSAHPDKVDVEFPCTKCTDKNLVFQSTSALLTHFKDDHSQETVFTCKFCRWPFLSKKELKIHKDVHVKKGPDPDMTDAEKLEQGVCKFNCWFCWELFPTAEQLQRHLTRSRRHKKLTVEFPCDDLECDGNQKPFKNVEQLNQHYGDVHSDKELFTCDRCDLNCLSENMLTYHKLNHVPRRASQFKCPACTHISGELLPLKDHYNHYHGLLLKVWKCDQCDERFTTKRGMVLHKNLKHVDTEELTQTGVACDKCGKMFKTEKSLIGHQNLVHTEGECPECGMIFPSRSKLYIHRKRAHDVGGTFLCTVCGVKFWEKSVLTKHMTFHTTKRFECHLCGIMMIAEEGLRKHIAKIHANDKPKPEQKFVCLVCGRGYSRKDSLDDHVRVKHTKDSHRVFECELCGKRFKRVKDFNQHNPGNSKTCVERVMLVDMETGTKKSQ